jgi:hypothetical protein
MGGINQDKAMSDETVTIHIKRMPDGLWEAAVNTEDVSYAVFGATKAEAVSKLFDFKLCGEHDGTMMGYMNALAEKGRQSLSAGLSE